MNEMDKDIIGEVMNISMGAGATALATILMKPVTITAPEVTIVDLEELMNVPNAASMLVRIEYTVGLQGVNLMTLKKSDIQIIMSALMGMDMEINEFDEMTQSAACEIMNQMMGSASTALSQFFSTTVDISTPQSHVVGEKSGLMQYFDVHEETIVIVKFELVIKDTLQTEFHCFLTKSIADAIIAKAKAHKNYQN